jgi:CheY-like chemotaxis protein
MNAIDRTPDDFSPVATAETATILIAEDDPSQQLLLRRAFRKAGFDLQTHFVSDGIEVLRYLERASHHSLPSLLLLDLKMPELDGFEVLEWLQLRPDLRPPYVVVFSSSPNSSDITRCSRLGVDHYLVKPSDAAELVATVKRLEPYWAEAPHILPSRRDHARVQERQFATAG